MALPVENSARFNHETRRMHFARDDALSLYFYPALCKDDAIEFPGNHHVISLDLPFHSRPFAEDQAVAGNHISLYMCGNAKHAGSLQRSFKPYALVEEAGGGEPALVGADQERDVEARSTALKKELGLRDLVLTQVVFVVGTVWVGFAAKLGDSQMAFWLIAVATISAA